MIIFHPTLLAIIYTWWLFYVPTIIGNKFPHYPMRCYYRKNVQCEMRGFNRAGGKPDLCHCPLVASLQVCSSMKRRSLFSFFSLCAATRFLVISAS